MTKEEKIMGSISHYRQGHTSPFGDEMLTIEHRVRVPLVWSQEAANSEKIEVFAREYRRRDIPEGKLEKLPWIIYLQGGPGQEGARYPLPGGWMAEATRHARLLMLDQRGTGLSTPINRHTLSGTPEEQASYLRCFRADSIVQDAEAFRSALGIQQWYSHGQSYGGFITGTYLSLFPESLTGSMISAGMPPLRTQLDDLYRNTYARTSARADEFFSWYPQDLDALAGIYQRVRTGEESIDGHRLRPGHIQRLGMFLGGNARVHHLHYLLSEAFERRSDGDLGLKDSFKRAVWNQFSQESSPLYTLLHETIYAEEAPTNFSAWRIAQELPEFQEEAEVPRLTGEMIYPWHLDEDPSTAPLAPAAKILAAQENMGALYDRARLAKNEVPVAAAVYRDDIFVDQQVSLEASEGIQGIQLYERDDLHHDGLGTDGPTLFKELAQRVGLLK